MNSSSITATAVSCLLLFASGCSAQDWEAVELTEESLSDQDCLAELESALKTILFEAGLSDPPIRQSHIQRLATEGNLDQSLTLYMGDEIRHWSLARVENNPDQCTLYNHAITRLDLATRQEDLRPRHLRGPFGQSAKLDLQICRCAPGRT